MNTETKPRRNIDDSAITQDSMDDVEVDLTWDDENDENEDQQNVNVMSGRTFDEDKEKN